MSKKNKAKFHKRIKAQLLREMSQVAQTPKLSVPAFPQPTEITQPAQVLPATPVETAGVGAPDKSLNYIKKDLKKSAFIIGSIIILIITLSIVDTKTNFLLGIGDQVFRVLHIGG